MKTSTILAESVIVGILAIYCSSIILNIIPSIITKEELYTLFNYKDLNILSAIFIVPLAYIIGFVINALAEKCFNGVRRSVEEKKLAEYKKKFNEKFIIDRMRYDLPNSLRSNPFSDPQESKHICCPYHDIK